jgi:hypothetical protein
MGIDVTNETHEKPAEHQYTVSIDDVTDDLMACTCPHHVHRNAFCKTWPSSKTQLTTGRLRPSLRRTTKTISNQ